VPPNSLQMLSRYEPALGVRPRPDQPSNLFARIAWRPSLGWAVGMSVVSALGILSLGQLSTFLYWQF
jgi:alginate O-acetyltransferase complex protein AlgI